MTREFEEKVSCIFCGGRNCERGATLEFRGHIIGYRCLGEIMEVAQLSKAMTEADSQKKATGEDIGYRYRC